MQLFFMVLVACNTPPQGGELIDPVHLVAIEVEPAEITLSTGPDGIQTQQFTAWAELDDGSIVELDLAEWTVSNNSAGEVDDTGLFTPSSDNGGITWVTAEYANESASATVTVVYHEELVEDQVDTTLFEGTAQPMEASPWLYPEDGSALPRNTKSINFQWLDLAAEAYRLHFTSTVSDIDLYMGQNGWESDSGVWQVIAGTNAGGSVEVELEAVVDGQLYSTDPLTLKVNRMDARGSIFYWTTNMSSIFRIPYGGDYEEYLSVKTTGGYCVGCHAISGGDVPLLAYSSVGFWHVDPDEPMEGYMEIRHLDEMDTFTLVRETEYTGDYKTFSPEGDLMLTSARGVLSMYDTRTGELLADITPTYEETGESMPIAHAEWMPSGDVVALTVAEDGMYYSWQVHGSRLYVMDYLGNGLFGQPELFVDPDDLYDDGAHIAYYPDWSPDSEWLAFNVSTGDSYDDEDAEVWAIHRDGGDAVLLQAANKDGGLTNSWPVWGPLPDDEVLWLAFSSKRDYGYTATADLPQVWVTTFDPTLAEAGEDPSTPAIWLVGQDPEDNNHVPVWVD